jgi:hypothetical protein
VPQECTLSGEAARAWAFERQERYDAFEKSAAQYMRGHSRLAGGAP